MMMFWWAVATTLIAAPVTPVQAIEQLDPAASTASVASPEIMTLGWVDEDDASSF